MNSYDEMKSHVPVKDLKAGDTVFGGDGTLSDDAVRPASASHIDGFSSYSWIGRLYRPTSQDRDA